MPDYRRELSVRNPPHKADGAHYSNHEKACFVVVSLVYCAIGVAAVLVVAAIVLRFFDV